MLNALNQTISCCHRLDDAQGRQAIIQFIVRLAARVYAEALRRRDQGTRTSPAVLLVFKHCTFSECQSVWHAQT